MTRVEAPFSPEQVEALNTYQRTGTFHPFTCGNERTDAAHQAYARENGDRDFGLLVATHSGWECPVCQYRQSWAYAFMAEPLPQIPGLLPQDPRAP